MLTRPDRITVVSSEGFALKHLGIYQLQYSEGGRTLTIEAESGRDNHGNFSQVIYLSAKQMWDCPHDREKVTDQERERIEQNLARALVFEEILPDFR